MFVDEDCVDSRSDVDDLRARDCSKSWGLQMSEVVRRIPPSTDHVQSTQTFHKTVVPFSHLLHDMIRYLKTEEFNID